MLGKCVCSCVHASFLRHEAAGRCRASLEPCVLVKRAWDRLERRCGRSRWSLRVCSSLGVDPFHLC